MRQVEYDYDDFSKIQGSLAKANTRGVHIVNLFPSFSLFLLIKKVMMNGLTYLHLHFAVKLNVRKLYSSLAKLETLVPKGTHEMPLSARKRGGHLSRCAEVKAVTQPYIQMGLCRVRPVTVLGTVGEIEISAQRLDLEGKHSVLLCDYGKSRTLVRYKWLIFTERAVTLVCPNSLCVIYEKHAMVKYPRQGLQRLRTGLSHHFNVPCDSQVLHRHVRPCKHTLYAWYK